MPILAPEPQTVPADLFERPELGPWWVARVASRQEKRLARLLRDRGLPHYLPQAEHWSRSGGKNRCSWIPLFAGYVFVRGGGDTRSLVRRTDLLVDAIDVVDQDTLDHELRALHALQLTGTPLVPWPELVPGDEVEIVDGPLKGHRGVVLREKGKLHLVVSITLLRQSVLAELDRADLAPTARRAG
jgi:transcriptional antiterminator RfaH